MALSGFGYAFDVTLYSENLTTNIKNYTAGFLPCFEAIKSRVEINQSNIAYTWYLYLNGALSYQDTEFVNETNTSYVITLYPLGVYYPNDIIGVELFAVNYSDPYQVFYDESVNKTYCFEGTTTTSSTSTTGGVTTTTMTGTTTVPGTSTTSGPTTSGPASSIPGTTLYGYALPDGNYGTLPSLNGTGGNTIGNGTLKNMPCTGFCIIGLNKDEFELYASILIVVLVLVSIKPFKLGASASAIALAFFNFILGWTVFTASFCLIFIVIAVLSWFMEAR
jgi:hypothetical protein